MSKRKAAPVAARPAVAGKGKTRADFRAAYDQTYIVPRKIEAGIASLAAEGPESWEPESAFATRIGVTTTVISRYRAEFVSYLVPIKNRDHRIGFSWACTPALAKELRGLSNVNDVELANVLRDLQASKHG